MERVDIKLGWECNNHCLFCVQGDKRYEHKPRSLDYVKKQLKEEAEKGKKGVVFTGGEPTMYKGLLEAVEYAKSLKYEVIQIQSNGQKFAQKEYLQNLILAGANEFSPAIHGFHPETHDKLTQTEGSRKKVVQGLKNLRKFKQPTIINTVITSYNYTELPKLARLLVSLNVTSFQFAFVHILGSADKNKNFIVPRKTDIMPYVHKALEIGRKNGTKCMTEAIPFCFMRGYERAIAEYNYMPETTVVDADNKTESYTEFRLKEGKTKGPPCQKCRLNQICEGPWKEYIDLYGWEEFKAIE